MKKILAIFVIAALLSLTIAYPAIAEETSADAAGNDEKATTDVTAAREKPSPVAARETVKAKAMQRTNIAKTELKEKREANDGKLVTVAERREAIKDRAGGIEVLKRESFAKVRKVEKARLEKLDAEKLERVASLKAEHVEKFAMLDRSRMKQLAQMNKTEIEAKLKRIKVVEADEGFRFRPLTIEQAQRSERAFEQLRENEGKLKERYEERIEKMKGIKERLKECRADSGKETCANVNEEAIGRSKEAASNAIERLTNHLGKVKERIESSQDMTEEEAADRIAKIDAILAELESIKAEIGAATTKEEMNAAVGKLRSILKRIKLASEEHTHSIIKAQIMGAIHRMDVMEKKADCSLSSLDEQGTDTSAVDAKLDEYASLVTSAREKIDEAKEAFNPEDKEAVEKARALVKEARNLVKQAKEKLDEIRRDIKELGGEICKEKQEIAIEEDDEQ